MSYFSLWLSICSVCCACCFFCQFSLLFMNNILVCALVRKTVHLGQHDETNLSHSLLCALFAQVRLLLLSWWMCWMLSEPKFQPWNHCSPQHNSYTNTSVKDNLCAVADWRTLQTWAWLTLNCGPRARCTHQSIQDAKLAKYMVFILAECGKQMRKICSAQVQRRVLIRRQHQSVVQVLCIDGLCKPTWCTSSECPPWDW